MIPPTYYTAVVVAHRQPGGKYVEELKSIGSIAQLGAFGVLVYIVYWTLRNVPQWINDSRKLRESEILSRETVSMAHRDSVAKLTAAHEASMREQMDRHDAQMRQEREDCERRHGEQMAAHKEEMNALKEMMNTLHLQTERLRVVDHTIREVAQSRANQDHLQRVRRSPRNDKGEES